MISTTLFTWLPVEAAKCRDDARLMAAGYLVATGLVGLSVLDVISTNMGLASGAIETNNLIKWFQEKLGPLWYFPRMLIQVGAAMMVVWYPRTGVLLVVAMVLPIIGYVVWNNFRIVGVV